MKVLFVSSGSSQSGLSPIVANQGKSLKKIGIDIHYFLIKKKGIWGYALAIWQLRHHLKKNNYQLIHAHYLLSGIVAGLAAKIPVVISLMGSDIYKSVFWRITVRLLSRFFWEVMVVKSKAMSDIVRIKRIKIIPNGVDLHRLIPLDKEIARRKVGFSNCKNIIFLAHPGRPEKNYSLAEQALKLLNNPQINPMIVSEFADICPDKNLFTNLLII